MSSRFGTAPSEGARTAGGWSRLSLSYRWAGVWVGLAEAAMILFGSASAQMAYETVWQSHGGDLGSTLGGGVLASVLYLSVARSAGLYRLPALIDPAGHLRRIAAVCGTVLLAVTAILFLLKIGSDVSRGTALVFAACMLVLCWFTRFAAAGLIERLIARNAIVGRPVILVGDADELAATTGAYLLRQFGLREAGRVLFAPGREGSGRAGVAAALDLGRHAKASAFVVAARWDHADRLAEIEQAFRASPLPVSLLPNHVMRSVLARHASTLDARPHLVELQRAPMSVAEQAAKRCVDVVGATLGLLLLSPIFGIVALAIRLDSPAPVIFRQRRNGFDQRTFVICKFRTMNVQDDGPSVVQAQRDDARVTRIGGFLRRTSIDELPQLWNVLKGEMSLVGPRPHALAHDEAFRALIGDYAMRHHVKPGITGWAQVNGHRGETRGTDPMRQRVELDLWYINNWSLLLDAMILVRTCFRVMLVDDAY